MSVYGKWGKTEEDGWQKTRRRSEPDYHDLPFVQIIIIDESFAKNAIRTGALEGVQE
jgi:hypothetical protein